MKILFWDIETSPLTVTTWNLWPKSINYENIVEEWNIITAAWKWEGDSKVYSVSVDPASPRDDRAVVEKLCEVLSEADVAVAHYGDKFDLPKFKARAVFHGLAPIPPILTIDTKKVASGIFGFTCNRLDYLGKFFRVGEKMPTSYGLWKNVMAGSAKSLRDMVKYNKQDVVLLEKVYLKLRPYMKNHPNRALILGKICCPTCGSQSYQKRGFRYNRVRTIQRYQCTTDGCRAWFIGETVSTAKAR